MIIHLCYDWHNCFKFYFAEKSIDAAKKFVRDVEEALVETAKEADRQRSFKEREADGLKHRLTSVKSEADHIIRRRLQDNSSLLFECNDLRRWRSCFDFC